MSFSGENPTPADPDSTMALLSSALPSVPNYPASDDDGEEEVFFGRAGDREKNGKFSVFSRRETIDQERLDRAHRRSWQVNKEVAKASFTKFRDRKSFFSSVASNSIDEEDEDEREQDDSENHSPGQSSSPAGKSVRFSPPKQPPPQREEADDTDELLAKPLRELKLLFNGERPEEDTRSPSTPGRRDTRSRSPLNSSGDVGRKSKGWESENRTEEAKDKDGRSQPDSEILRRLGAELDARDTSAAASEISLNSSAASEWFDNTHDEMILFEKFGENYDDVVAGMTVEERKKLKREVARMTPKTAEELLGEKALQEQILEDRDEEEEEGVKTPVNEEDYVVKAPVDIVVHSPAPVPKPRTMTPQKKKMEEEEKGEVEEGDRDELERSWEKAKGFSPRMVESGEALQALRDDLRLALTPKEKKEKKTKEDAMEKMPPPPPKANLPSSVKRPSPRQPTPIKKPGEGVPRHRPAPAATSNGDGLKTPEKRSQPRSKFFLTPGSGGGVGRRNGTPRAVARTPSYMHPTSASKHRASPKKDPITNETLEVTLCDRHGWAHGRNHFSPPSDKKRTPSHHQQQHLRRRLLPSAVDMDRVVSPVAQYIRQHPAPPLIRQVKPVRNRHQADEAVAAACAAEDPPEEPERSPPSHHFAALPEAVYRPSRIAVEKELRGQAAERRRKEATLPKAFGKVDSVEATVVRHVAREKVPADALVDLKSRSGSPSKHLRIQERPQRESEAFQGGNGGEDSGSSSLIEMSIREVKKVVV